jgi:ABC-type phosphate/phosphonate transport system substrate-binding protein
MLARNYWLLLALPLITGALATPASADLILTTPPRETLEDGQRVFGPLAEALSKATGEKVVYQYADNWGLYQTRLTKGDFDLVLDGPHLVSWRFARLHHEPLVALAGNLSFVVITRKDDTQLQNLNGLAGRRLCGHAPPNLATLTVYEQFENAARQPLLVETKGFDVAYKRVLERKCNAAVLPLESYHDLEGQTGRTRVIYQSKNYPNQALTAGARVTPAMRERIQQALLADNGHNPTAKSVANYFHSDGFVPTDADQYRGYDHMLSDTWGFDTKPKAK